LRYIATFGAKSDVIFLFGNDFVENRGMRVNMNKTKVMISGEWQKVMQKAVR